MNEKALLLLFLSLVRHAQMDEFWESDGWIRRKGRIGK